jgi:uncharacterized protein HemX
VVELANKIVANMAAILGLAAVIFGIILVRWSYVNVQVQKLRDELNYRTREVEQKDRELADIRKEFQEIKKLQIRQEKRIDDDFEQFKQKDAQLYAQEKYIHRLETLCQRQGLTLPKRPDRKIDWEEEEP